MMMRLPLSGVLLVALTAPVRAASFDCNTTLLNAVEKLVCADAEVSKLDEYLADAYEKARIADPEWKARQHTWLSTVRNRCADATCMKEAYQRQLSILEAATRTAEAPASLSFDKPPYINPRIIEALATWDGDHGDQVVAINLADAQMSRRFAGETLVEFGTGPGTGRTPGVYFVVKNGKTHKDETEFSYKYVGQTASGVHVLRTQSFHEGSGILEELLFVTIEPDLALSAPETWKNTVVLKRDRKRLLIRRLGAFRLSRRFVGQVAIKGRDLVLTDALSGRSQTLTLP
jgi:uncharacterized protein